MGALMLDQPEQEGGKINWPMAIGLSVVVHIAVLGFFWLVSGPSAARPEPAEEKESASAAPVQPADGPAASVAAPSGTGSSSAAPSVPATPAGTEATENYTVKPGDFPSRIARANGCTVADLKRLNGAVIDKTLHPGQILKIPAK